MSDLIFCHHCGLTIYALEKACPYCKTKEPEIGLQTSKTICLSILMGLTTIGCRTDLKIEPSFEKSESHSAETTKDQPIKIPEQQAETVKENIILSRPERPLQSKYGLPSVERPKTMLTLSAIQFSGSLATERKQHLRMQILRSLRGCSASDFLEDASFSLTLSLQEGIVTKPDLNSGGLTTMQQNCLEKALYPKTFSVPYSGSITLTIQVKN